MIHYGVSKAAQIAVARGRVETTTETGVRVNSVLPGPTRSEGVEAFIQQVVISRGASAAEIEKDFFKTVRPTSPIKRFITPNEVAPLGQQYEMINKILLAGLERILKQAGAK
jgi:NAD(P)-dependent dehydrogenase (short-subunit alcohol dehydrogenase family)